jgi:hypothetical protein
VLDNTPFSVWITNLITLSGKKPVLCSIITTNLYEISYFTYMSAFDNQSVRSLGNLELLANQVVEGFIIGLHKSPFHGFSVEFAEHRLYNPGEATKNLDWKVFARTDRLYTKKFEEETNLRCQILLDTSSSMFFPDAKVLPEGVYNKMGFAALAAASLMNLLKKQRDAFGLSIFQDEVKLHTVAKSTNMHYRLMLGNLEKAYENPTEKNSTKIANALHQIADSIHKRSLVVIFSDMFEAEDDLLFDALQHLKHAKHEVVLFHITDHKRELNFEFENRPHLFVDLETGEEVRLQPQQIKEHYISTVKNYVDNIKEKCLQYKVDYVEADINKGFFPILQAYLVKRSRMRI